VLDVLKIPAVGARLFALLLLGGKGSGNFGHAGGEGGKGNPGGSAPDAFGNPKSQRSPKGPTLKDQSNLRPATKADAARMKELGFPPAWTDVMISDDPDAPYFGTGVDEKGRTQPKMNPAQTDKNAAVKFARVREFSNKLPAIRKSIIRDLDSENLATREDASVLYLIDRTGFRPGAKRDRGGDVEAFGASTLKSEHVSISGSRVTFSFVGKKGVEIDKTVDDARLAKILTPRLASPGTLFDTSDGRAGRYMKTIADPSFIPKDFRTYHGTAKALSLITRTQKPKTEEAYKGERKRISTAVSKHLGNTPEVAIKSYIDPAAWGKWKK